MQATIALVTAGPALAAAASNIAWARFRHKSIESIVAAWQPDNGFDLPAAIEAARPRHPRLPRARRRK
jgi:hypothetical protein